MRIEVITAEDGLVEVHALLMHQYVEAALAPVDMDKVWQRIFYTAKEGFIFAVRDENGKMIGTTGLSKGEFWYSKDEYWLDTWTYVDRDERGKEVFDLLMKACGSLARSSGLKVIIAITNPNRKSHRPKWVAAQGYLIAPLGPRIILDGQEAEDDGLRVEQDDNGESVVNSEVD